MISAIVLVLALYCSWLLILTYALPKIKANNRESKSTPTVAVVVPFRNEMENLEQLVNSLKGLKYDALLEVFLVNDHSEDEFLHLLSNLPDHFKLLHLPSTSYGKKAALALGISQSSAEIIITTDADCSFQSHWVYSFISYFQNNKVKLVFGGVKFKEESSFWKKLQTVEFAPVIGVGAASAALGYPIMCNGANLAFRKSVFDEVEGYNGNDRIASGDDEFLMFKIHHKYPKSVVFNRDNESVVETEATSNLRSFIQQRKRWASKWSSNTGGYKLVTAVLVTLSAFASLAAFIVLAFSSTNYFLLGLLIIKMIIEGMFIAKVNQHLKKKFYFLPFIFLQFVYPFYGISMVFISNFGKYHWKGRVH